MSMMGSPAVADSGANPMEALIAMRGMQQGPIGPGQGLGAPQLGAPPAASGGSPMPPQTNGTVQDVLNELATASTMGGDEGKLFHHVRQIQKMYPKMALAHHKNGHGEMTGPAAEQFLAAAYARSNGAKTAHVRNDGRGQRLHLEFE